MIADTVFKFIKQYDRENDAKIQEEVYKDLNILAQLGLAFPSLKDEHIIYTCLQYLLYFISLGYHLTILILTLFVVYEDLQLFNLLLHYTLLFVLTAIFITIGIFNRKYLCRMYKIISSGFFNYNEGADDEEVIKIKQDIRKQKYLCALFPVYILIITGYVVVIGPLLDQYLGTAEEGPYSEKGLNLLLPIPGWYPFKTHEGIIYYMTILGQAFTAGTLGLVIGTFNFLYIDLAQNAELQLRILTHSISKLEMRAKNRFNKLYPNDRNIKGMLTDDRYYQCYFYCIRQNIIHHQLITKFIKYIESYGAICLLCGYSTATLVIALAIYEIAEGTGKLVLSINSGLLIIAEILSALSLSLFAENITQAWDDLNEAIYSTEWYKNGKNPYIKGFVSIMLERTKKPVILKCILVEANFETFSTVMNTAYSYYNLLKATKGD